METSLKTTYVLDGSDIIRYVDHHRADGSQSTDSRLLYYLENLIGQSFWNFIPHWEVANFYRLVLESVRQGGQSITVPFQWENLTFSNNNMIAFSLLTENQVLATTYHVPDDECPDLESSDRGMTREELFVHLCSWCRAIQWSQGCWRPLMDGLRTLKTEQLCIVPVFSHGICPTCYDKQITHVTAQNGKPDNQR
ncbi:MAG: hypothetical protein KC940_04490 [Candidatus Omnitrophica bacterium]|nr:hypothetical protein [Candidatus Omnitrophota bacterium]MCA9423987.1 hypothetical protein [Candidatus Omnitrophota bacterium]MCA9429750.1 hypothetical protein [Candidatus Omnitrophota bacterium]MCA9436080.1 hypothetical protein [Candidatus Omnitrophota bacterium]